MASEAFLPNSFYYQGHPRCRKPDKQGIHPTAAAKHSFKPSICGVSSLLVSLLYTSLIPLKLLPTLFVASLGILSGSPPLLLFAPVLLFSFSSLFLLLLLSPSPSAFLLRFPLLSLFSLKVFAQSGSAQRGSTFVVLAQSGRLSPCRRLSLGAAYASQLSLSAVPVCRL